MKANVTYVYMVRCKCPGSLGTARVEVNYTENRGGYDAFVEFRDNRYPAVACWGCRSYFKIASLVTKLSRTHVCGAKCLSSRGPSCECSCGGANHGAGWAA